MANLNPHLVQHAVEPEERIMMPSASSLYRRWFFARGAAKAAVSAAVTLAFNADDTAAHFGGGQ